MKRKNNNKRKIEHRMRRTRVILDKVNLAFDLTTPSEDVEHGIEVYGDLTFIIRFISPLDKEYASTSYLTVVDTITKRADTTIVVLPKTEHKSGVTYGDDLDYIQFATHAVHVINDRVYSVHLTLMDMQMRGDTDVRILEPRFNYGMGWFPEYFRYEPLKFFPIDLPVKGKSINLSKVPQGQSLATLKPSGGITGNRTGRLLGYYASAAEPEPFNNSGWLGVSIRFGNIHESTARAIYLTSHPEYAFEEIGFLSLGDDGKDGAMPDGLITEGETTWPVEIKTSRTKDTFEGSNISQCMWEMATGPFAYIDLVKYSEKQVQNDEGNWVTKVGCKEVRLFRNEEAEENIIKLCKQADACKSHKEFYALVQTEPYLGMRKYLDELADMANASAKSLDIPHTLLETMAMYKQSILDTQAEDVLTTHPIMNRIEKRQANIFALQQEPRKVKEYREQVCQQIKDYTDLIK